MATKHHKTIVKCPYNITEWNHQQGTAQLEVDRLRREDFSCLYHPQENPNGIVYLDHAGATLYAESQLDRCHQHLKDKIFGNPHSKGPISSVTGDQVDTVRSMVLEHFNASPQEWSVVFTSGATAALKLVAEIFPWQTSSRLIYAQNSHTSVLGMREVAISSGASFSCLHPNATGKLEGAIEEVLRESSSIDASKQEIKHDAANGAPSEPVDHLLVLPAECNFSGQKLDLPSLASVPRQWPRRSHTASRNHHRLTIMLDAAKYVGTNPLDLSTMQADLVCLSFYKMFGYPTGLGCLLLRSSLVPRLSQRRRYFGGGTVLAALPHTSFRLLRADPSHRLADGTQDFLGIMAIKEGLSLLQSLTMPKIQTHTFALTRFLYDELSKLRHANGQAVCYLYTSLPKGPSTHGSIVTFNFLRPSGDLIGYSEIEKLMGLHAIQLRTGCFCNPGACQEALGLTEEDVHHQLEAGHVCWDDNDIVDGRATGAVRVSFGYMSTWEDVTAFLHVLEKYFVSKSVVAYDDVNTSLALQMKHAENEDQAERPLVLGSILIYPIKSCGGFQAAEWPLSPTGLLFDREWALIDGLGQALRLNRVPKMRFIRPKIDLESQTLIVTAPGMSDLRIKLGYMPPKARLRDVSVCGEACQGLSYQAEVDAWFSTYLERACSLVRSSPYTEKRRNQDRGSGAMGGGKKGRSKASLGAATVVARRGAGTSFIQEEEGQHQDGGDENLLAHEEEEETKSSKQQITFANEAQYLLVCTASVDHLNGLIAQQMALDEYEFRYEGQRCTNYVTMENFRPNLVVNGGVPHQEDSWDSVEIVEECKIVGEEDEEKDEQGVAFQVTGPCARCSMVNMDHRSDHREGLKDQANAAPVLKTLASYRRDKSNIYFGQFLALKKQMQKDGWLRVGMKVKAATQ